MTDRHQREGEEPIWRRDFPYSAEGEEEITRREFARYAVLASAAFAGGGSLVSLGASLQRVNVAEPRPLVALDQVAVGNSFLFSYPTEKDPAILIRPSADLLLGFGQKCTHLGCAVFWVPEDEEFHCPCHQGVFDATGLPIAGPPTRALTRIEVEVRDGMVWALGTDGGER